MEWKKYWSNKFLGIDYFKINFILKKYLWKIFKIQLPKLKDQKNYWNDRGKSYFEEFISSGYKEREVFYQNIFIELINKVEFKSILELGCGFGWNLKRIQDDFDGKEILGIDFSIPQLDNAKKYLDLTEKVNLVNGDLTKLPYQNNSVDITFSFGVFMNLHKDKINLAVDEAIRITKKKIIHVEPINKFYTEELSNNRVFKTNIVSHDYIEIYKSKGLILENFLCYKDFSEKHLEFKKKITSNYERWEPIEDCSKYCFLVFSKNKK
jgi:ubiquinone/menaquinone biosynthesis C-methylase UbiE